MPEFEHLLDRYTCQDIKGGVCVWTFFFPRRFGYTCATICPCVGFHVSATGWWYLQVYVRLLGEEWEPQFLYGPICFVLFVLLINEIRGAACWDGPTAPPLWTGPLSHELTLFSKWMLSFFPSLCSLIITLFLSLYLYQSWFDIFFYLFFFVLQFITQVDTLGHVRWLLVVD